MNYIHDALIRMLSKIYCYAIGFLKLLINPVYIMSFLQIKIFIETCCRVVINILYALTFSMDKH